MDTISTCPICKEAITSSCRIVTLREKGAIGINSASTKRDDSIQVEPGQRVHVNCRRDYCSEKQIAADLKPLQENAYLCPSEPRSTRKDTTFIFSRDCLFCGKEIKTHNKAPKYFSVRTETKFQETIKGICLHRNDALGKTVLGRLEFAGDLHAKDAIYHQTCCTNFRLFKRQSESTTFPQAKARKFKDFHSPDYNRHEAFLQTVQYLRQYDDETTTVKDLVNKMAEFSDNPYSTKHMKRKLVEHMKEEVFIADAIGENSYVTLRAKASDILHDFNRKYQYVDDELAKESIIKAAADLIKSDVKMLESNKDEYPDLNTISDVDKQLGIIPNSLKTMINSLIVGKGSSLKVAAIGQAIMQGIRPRMLLCPLQVGLGVTMHHQHGSKQLVESLNKLGFCSSYSEVKTFENSAAAHHNECLIPSAQSSCVQFAADNVDHNLRTLDGYNTFHGMGSIAVLTPSPNWKFNIPRTPSISAKYIAELGKIKIHPYTAPSGSCGQTFERIQPLAVNDQTADLDVLWKTTQLLRPCRPLWSGFMSTAYTGEHHNGKSSVIFLPLIDMDPTNLTCIFSTLHFIAEQCKYQNFPPVVTFDQPLYAKALTIISKEPSTSLIKNIVLRLGGFHMMMSFLGSIGYIMTGTGFQDALETIYASNTIPHIMSGKAFSRSLRSHILICSALHTVLLKSMVAQDDRLCSTSEEPTPELSTSDVLTIPERSTSDALTIHEPSTTDALTIPEPSTSDALTVPEPSTSDAQAHHVFIPLINHEAYRSSVQMKQVQQAAELFDEVMAGTKKPSDVSNCETTTFLKQKIQEKKENDQANGNHTSQLWFTYLEMMDVLLRFIKAERTSNWSLHLSTVREMLPYFAATGHIAYFKSSTLYLSSMLMLQNTSPAVYDSFIEGYHTARRSDRCWAGLSIDLMIEQVLMRNIKSIGGLTHGRGMQESERNLWVLSMPACAALSEAMTALTIGSTREKCHTDVTQSRLERDAKDMAVLYTFFSERDPFQTDTALRNIATGVIAHTSVNVFDAKNIGEAAINNIEGQKVDEFKFKKTMQARNFNDNEKISVGKENILIDPKLLFQRLLMLIDSGMTSLADALEYELTSFPSSLFEASHILRPANKPSFSEGIKKMVNVQHFLRDDLPNTGCSYVLDGGSLLQRLPWDKLSKYSETINKYVNYVRSKYGNATIVFDGYPDHPTVKDVTHLRRKSGSSPTVNFSLDMPIILKKDTFLSNKENKRSFIAMLGKALKDNGQTVIHAPEDADVLIARTAIETSCYGPTVLIGEDTDLLVLLCQLSPPDRVIFFKSELKGKLVWDIKILKETLGDVCTSLAFAHALLGCDTTSRIFGLGKAMSLKKLQDTEFIDIATIFNRKVVDQNTIVNAGERALLLLFGTKHLKSLNEARVRKLTEKTAKSRNFVQPQCLPPTSSAAKFHSLRVYYQVHQWLHKSEISPTDWGWQIKDGMLLPTMTEKAPAPQSLLKIVRCGCKSNCETARCTCRKHGLPCTQSCSDCYESCTNARVTDDHESDSDDEMS